MKHDLCLRFPDEATAIETLPQFHDAENGWHLGSQVHALDPCDPVELHPALCDPDTLALLNPPVIAEGFHINLLTNDDELAEALAPFTITPTNRKRVWA
jgi:hypothetical protein